MLQVMEWAIASNSANILTHLRELGYSIPVDIIDRHPLVIRDYLLGKQPLLSMPGITLLGKQPLLSMPGITGE